MTFNKRCVSKTNQNTRCKKKSCKDGKCSQHYNIEIKKMVEFVEWYYNTELKPYN